MFSHPTHILAVTGFVRNSDGHILLVYSPRRGWEMPGGQVENGEDLFTSLQREIVEESGIETEIGRLLAAYSNIAHNPITKLMLTFEAFPIGGTLQTTAETLDAAWFPPAQALEKVTHPAQHLKLQDALIAQHPIYRVYQTNPFQLLHTTSW